MRHGSAHWEKRGIALRHDSYMLSQMQVQTNSPQPMLPHVEATMPTLSLMHAKSDSLLPSRPRRLARAIVRGLPLLAVALAASACTVITGPDGRWRDEQRDLSWARRTWSSQFISDYEYVVRRNCYCVMGGVAVRVVVQGDRVVSREIEGSGVSVPVSMAYLYPTIDGLFSVVQEAIDSRADDIDTSYDSRYGFPTDIWIDYDRGVADEEEGYALIRFRSLR